MVQKDSRFIKNTLFAYLLIAGVTGTVREAASATSWVQHKLTSRRTNCLVTVTYPAFIGREKGIQALNSEVRKAAQSQYCDAVKKHSSDTPNEPHGEFTAAYVVESKSNNVASLSCKTEDYTTGAATSSTSIQTLNYSLHPLEELQIEDLFKPALDHREILKIVCLKALYATTLDANLSIDVANSYLHEFAINKHGLVLFFVTTTPNEVMRVTVSVCQIRHLMVDSLAQKLWSPEALTESTEEQNFSAKDLERQLAIVAIGTYSEMIDAHPTNGSLFRERAVWYKKLGREEVAAKDLAAASRLELPQTDSTVPQIETSNP